MTVYVYGMRCRGFSPGCQPMRGFLYRDGDPSGRYFDKIAYERKLSEKELREYELTYLYSIKGIVRGK